MDRHIHIVDLASAEAARAFVEDEPYDRAGLFEHHVIRRFENLLGRTMWESPEGSADPRLFVIAPRPAAQWATRLAEDFELQVHDWEFGGRR